MSSGSVALPSPASSSKLVVQSPSPVSPILNNTSKRTTHSDHNHLNDQTDSTSITINTLKKPSAASNAPNPFTKEALVTYLTAFYANPIPRIITLFTEALHVLFVLSFYDFVKILTSTSTTTVNGQVQNTGQYLGYMHALRVIQLEQNMGAFFEARLQQVFLPFAAFLKFWNLYYVAGHFVVTIGVIVFLALRYPRNYQAFRNLFFWMNIIGVFFYAIYPLMPPRLISRDCLPSGTQCPDYGFVDTLADERYAIIVNPTKTKAANSYAAMPSMHIGWALCVGLLGFLPLAKKTWLRVLSVLYPICMVYCIIITANHFWLDAVGGLVTFMVTYSALQYYPQEVEYGHGADKGYENHHYAAWVGMVLAVGVFFMNPVIVAKVLAFCMFTFFAVHCAKNRIIPFMHTPKKMSAGRSLPL